MSVDSVSHDNPVIAVDPEEDDSVKAVVSRDQRDSETIAYDYRLPGCTNLSEGEIRLITALFIGIAVFVVVFSLARAYGDGLQDDLQPGQSYHGEPGIGGCNDPAVCCNCD
jgi:hypothetical protein